MGKILHKIFERMVYPSWIKNNEPNQAELEVQKEKRFSYEPLISIVCPLYNTPKLYLREMIQSVLEQTYKNFELCLVDAGSEESGLREIIEGYHDKRIIYEKLERNYGISDNTNRAIALATGEYIGFLDHDDVLAPFALYEVVKELNKNSGIDFFYSDEDQFTTSLKTRKNPFFKPNFSPNYLYGLNYICHFVVVRKDLLERTGGLRKDFDGSQDYDFVLRATKHANRIAHIPKILYHWRVHKNSVASGFGAKNYAQEAGLRALQSFFEDEGESIKIKEFKIPGRYQPTYCPKKTLVTIVIYNENEKNCMRTIKSMEIGNYKTYEMVIVGKTISHERYLAESDITEYGALHLGAISAKGDFILFLHSSFFAGNAAYLETLLSYGEQKNIGVVGSKLVNENSQRIFGLGMAMGVGFLFSGRKNNDRLYFDKGILTHEVSGVPYYGLLTRKADYLNLGGFKNSYLVGHNVEMDYCIKLKMKGLNSVVVPQCELYTAMRQENVDLKEIGNLYPSEFCDGDYYYHPELSSRRGGYYIDARKNKK